MASTSRRSVSSAPTGGCGERRSATGRSPRSDQAGQRPRRCVAASAGATARDAAVAQGAHGGAAIALVAISGAVFWALQNNRHRNTAPEELYSTDHRTTADGLAGLPRDYAGIPRQAPPLGPPLPGDLGRPMLNAGAASNTVIPTAACGRSGGAAACAGDRGGAVEPAVRIDQYPGAALGHADTASAATPDASAASGPTAQPSTDTAFAQNGQDENSPSSTPRSIAGRRASIGWNRPSRPMSCRPAPSSPAR